MEIVTLAMFEDRVKIIIKRRDAIVLQNFTRFAVIGCASMVLEISSIASEIMPSLSQPIPEPNSNSLESAGGNSVVDRDAFIRALKHKFPNFYTFDDLSPDLKARAVRQNGVLRIQISPGETATLPNGDRVEADGSLVKKNGVRFQTVKQDGQFLRYRVFKPNGTELNPGEKYTAPDGMIIVMPNVG